MFNKLQLHEQENSTNKNQQSIIVVYIGLFTRPIWMQMNTIKIPFYI